MTWGNWINKNWGGRSQDDGCDRDDKPTPPAEPKPCSSFIIEGPVRIQITVTEMAGGKLQVDVKVLDGAKTGDLRGLFFDVADEDLLSGLKVEGADVTGAKFAANCVTSVGGRGNSANVNGEVANEFGAFDAGVLLGSAGIGKNDIQETSFVLSHATLDLTDDLLSAQDFAVRLTSVGVEGGARCDSLKLGATAPVFCGDPEPEPCACVCDEKIDFNDLAKGTIVSDQYDGVTISANVTRQIAIHVEAEHMHRTGFAVASGHEASGDKLVKLTGHQGALATTFSGPTGEYDVKIRVQDENDGRSTIALRIDGHVVKTFKLDANNNGAGSDNGHFNTVTLHDVDIPKGARVELVATRDGHEFVRIDKISFHGSVTENRAMIFDANHITGGDHDLRNGDGKVLIISEDGDRRDPDDNARGGSFHFDFDKPSKVTSIDVVDTEEGGKITAFAADGAVIGVVDIPRLRDAEVRTVKLGFEGVAKLVVTLNGSGAVDDLCYEPEKPAPLLGTLGDFLFHDANRNGVQDTGEAGIDGVTVRLLNAAGEQIATATTADGGKYLFTGLAAGTYGVAFAAVAGKQFTLQDAGADDALDSDVDANGLVTGIVLAEGQNRTDVDAGVFTPNASPTADDDLAKTCADDPVTVDALDGDTDSDGGVLQITAIAGELVAEGGSVILVGGVTVTLSGGKLVVDGSTSPAVVALAVGETSTTKFAYTVSDGQGGSATATVSVEFCGAAETLVELAASLPTTASYQIVNEYGNGSSDAFSLKLSNTGDVRFDNVEFDSAYCVSALDPALGGPNFAEAPIFTANLFLADAAAVPDSVLAGQVGLNGKTAEENLDLVNWVLNQDFNSKGFTDAEVQAAIWGLTDQIDFILPAFGSLANVRDIRAQAEANGEGFTPGEDDIVGIIVDPNPATTANSQPFIIGVAFEDIDCLC